MTAIELVLKGKRKIPAFNASNN